MRFLQSATVTLVFKFLAIAFGLGISIVISRTLGPSGRGIYGLIMTLVMLVSTFATFGLNTANTYYISKDPRYSRLLGKRAIMVGFVGSFIATVVVVCITIVKPDIFEGMDLTLLLLTMVIVLFYLWGKFFSQSYLGQNNIVAFNLFNFGERFIFLVAAILVLWFLNGTITQYVTIVMIALGLFITAYLWFYFSKSPSTKPPADLPFLESLLYGIRPYTAALFTMVTLRSGLFFVNGILGTEATGLFAVAQQFSELLIIFPSVVGNVLFPRVASDNATDLTARVIRTTALLIAPVFIAIAWFTEPLIVLLFGPEFKSAASALLILLPGTYLLGLEVIMAGDISGRGYPWPAALVWIGMAVLNITGYLILIPLYGIEGAALSTSVVFIIVFIFMTIYLKRITSVSFNTLFIPTRADLQKLLSFPKLLITSRLKS